MKLKRTFLALSAMILGVGIFFSAPAMAQGNHNCSEGSIDEPFGDIIIFDTTGGCALGSLNAGGHISITSNGPVTIGGAVTSVDYVNISATGALVTSGNLSSSTSGITLAADTTITVNGVTNSAGGLALYSQNGGNIHVVGSITGGAVSAVSIISDIGGTGTITVDSTITAGFVDMQANGNIHVVGTINSTTVGSHVDIKTMAAGGTIKLDGVVTAPGQVVQLVAFGNISTKTIDTTSTASGTGDVRIIANKGASGAIPAFVIGGASNSNGVNGSIITNTQSAGGQGVYTTSHNVGIVNGGPSATGGITIVNGSNISVAATSSKAGCIILDARNGPFTLQAGTLSANGAAGQSAGCIAISADTATIGSNGTISANDDGTKGYNHYVTLSAKQLTVTGTVNLTADGKGVDTSFPAAVLLLAEGSQTIIIPEDYSTGITPPTRMDVATALTVNGSGSLVLRANGAINRAEVVAKPITFSNTGTLTITANGASPNKVQVRNPGSNTNVAGINFTGGNVIVRSNGVSGVGDAGGGKVEIYGDLMTLNANTFTFNANGPTAGNGNGGTFYFASSAATLKSTGKVTVTANAASAGTGDAILGDITTGDPKAIQFFPGSVNIDVGTASALGQYSFAAKGGSTGGNGGTVYMGASALTLKTANAINAAALGGNGDGGEIYLNNFITVDPAATVTAIGKGTGKGGKFTAFYFDLTPLNVNKVIKVNGGNSLRSAAENDFGRIKLNTITCQQRTTGQTTWPVAYWNCAHPDGSDLDETNVRDAIKAIPFKTLLTNGSTPYNPYIFDKASDAISFFSDSGYPTVGVLGVHRGALLTVSVWRQMDRGDGTFADVSDFMRGAAMHEIGHAVDSLSASPSQIAPFSTASASDQASIAATACTTVFGGGGFNATVFCNTNAGFGNSWQILSGVFIKQQNVNSEMFAFGFQRCSGWPVYFQELVNAETHMTEVYKFFDGNPSGTNAFWPGAGACPGI